jgi:hypothetical protein
MDPQYFAAQTADSRATIVAVAQDNTWAHVYVDTASLIADRHSSGAGATGPIDFFDSAGNRLLPLFTPGWSIQGLTPEVLSDGQPPDCEAVRDRLRAVIAHVQAYVLERFDELVWPGVTRPSPTAEAAIKTLQDLMADETLGGLVAAFGALFGVVTPANVPVVQDRRGWWHNVLHASGWTH